MLINRDNWKLHRTWIVLGTCGLILAVIGLYDFSEGGFRFPGGSSTTGYLLGVVAGLIIVFEVLLWPRKKLMRRWRIGRVRTWMSAHIWLGLLTVPLSLVHSGFPWSGSVASMTMILLLVVVGSGVFGLCLQHYIPRKMTQSWPNETVYTQIALVAKQIVAEADALVSATTGSIVGDTDWSELYPADKGGTDGTNAFVGARRSIVNIYGRAIIAELPTQPILNTQIIASAYESQIRNYLQSGKKGTSLFKDANKQRIFFADLSEKVVPEAQFLVDSLNQSCHERRQFDQQESLHRWLHLWLGVHLPLSIALLVLLVWHATMASYFSGIFSFF